MYFCQPFWKKHLLFKIYIDRFHHDNIATIFSSYYLFQQYLTEMHSFYPVLNKHSAFQPIDENLFKTSSMVLKNIDFSKISFSASSAEQNEIFPDYKIERSIFDTNFEINGLYDLIIKILLYNNIMDPETFTHLHI